MSGPEELYYRQSLFRTRLLGEVVEIAFDCKEGDLVGIGESIGWFEGFKARSDLCSVAGGVFLRSDDRPLLRTAPVCRGAVPAHLHG